MQIVLVRHGIAEDASYDKNDFQRNLTSDGIDKFKSQIPGLLALFNGFDNVEIWHSPTKRTTHTAQILHAYIPEAILTEKDFIMENDFSKFSDTLKLTVLPELLIIVGHEPGMSIWSKKIAGVNIKFSKGACAGFIVKDKNNLTGKMEFFLQPSALTRLGGKI